MRRSDREVTDLQKIKEIIRACDCCRLGLCDAGKVYIVPLNFGYTEQGGKHTFYFHSAKEGRKITLLSQNPCVGFELDTGYQLIESAQACGYSARFQSIIGTGTVTMLHTPEEKRAALQEIMMRHTGKEDWQFPEDMLEAVCVFRLDVEELSCKEHR